MRIDNSFEVPVAIDQAWSFLNDIPAVVPCIPGAELNETLSDDEWKATVHVKLGPVALQFAADITRVTVDEDARKVVLQVTAREVRGRGGAQATVDSRLREDSVGTRAELVTDITLQGAVAQYGRGIVPQVASQLTRQFADNIARVLEGTGGSHDLTAHTDREQRVVPVPALRLVLSAIWRAVRRAVRV